MKQSPSLYRFLGPDGTFASENPERFDQLTFPLTNEAGMLSCIGPALAGNVTLDQHTFLTVPSTTEDLHLNRSSRNFWLTFDADRKISKTPPWSVAGRSVWQRDGCSDEESVSLKGGFLWHEVTRTNKKIGLQSRVLNFVPAAGGTVEVMFIEIRNLSKKPMVITGTSAIPLYGRSADNVRDHRHVTSLLNRLSQEEYGIRLQPTMSFNERGHRVNSTSYVVLGADENGAAPVGLFPTVATFIGEDGDLEHPAALTRRLAPHKSITFDDQGKEAMGALQFKPVRLAPKATTSFTLLLGVERVGGAPLSMRDYQGKKNVMARLEETKSYWEKTLSRVNFETGDETFNRWMRWVKLQPILRKIFGCSFLPDFDYGRGGRGWRDLWQDCLALLLINPDDVRGDMIRNFGGVRIDGSNATVITRDGDFVADRNNITRTWMDHGIWPCFTTLLYINQSGDWNFLLEKAPYFRDALLHRGRKVDAAWARMAAGHNGAAHEDSFCKLKTPGDRVYLGSILEHILIQTLVPFFNVGEHNNIRLEDADWNDGMDMARERGESVAFTNYYAGNLESLANALEVCRDKAGWQEVTVAEELILLLDRAGSKVNYDNVADKTKRLQEYFETVEAGIKGNQASVPLPILINDLKEKAAWLKRHLNEYEWVESGDKGWFNGYYDNEGARVEGVDAEGRTRMTLTGQVYPILAGVADNERIQSIIKSVDGALWDKNLEGYRLNTDFGDMQPTLGRAFSFVYGEKENGSIFSHMVVMYANALYQRGFVAAGHRALASLYKMAKKCERSRIYPGLPEYFNNEGRGRYPYLTGSASWYVLTLLTQVFGVRGESGDLLLSPKLDPSQFNKKGEASVEISFAGTRLEVVYHNPGRLTFDTWKIKEVTSRDGEVPCTRRGSKEIVIQRELVARHKDWRIDVYLGKER